MNIATEQDIERLRMVAILLERQVDVLNRKIADLAETPAQALSLFREVERELKADSSEKPKDKDKEDKDKKKNKDTKKPKKGHGPTPQPKLDFVEEEPLKLDEADQICPACGETLQEWEGQFETAEEIGVIECKYSMRIVRRQKYRCTCNGCVETAPPTTKAIPGGRYGLDFAAKVATDKYLDHLPLARQVRIMARHGLTVRSQTLFDQIHALAKVLTPHHESLLSYILGQPVIGLDQTSWPRLEKGHSKRSGGKPWQMWGLTLENAAYYAICDDKSTKTALQLLGDFDGVIVCDQLSTHHSAARAGPFSLAGCWAHIVRRFREAGDSPQAKQIRALIKELYEIDSRATDVEHRALLRAQESAAVLKQLKKELCAIRGPKSVLLNDAARHTLAFWPQLTRFKDNPHVWLDNNRTERALRGPVVGRKNHYGSKSRRGRHTAAVLYSLLETAKLCDVEPASYLHQAAKAKLDYDELLLPWML